MDLINAKASGVVQDTQQLLLSLGDDDGSVEAALVESLQMLEQLDRGILDRADGLAQIAAELNSLGADLQISSSHFQLQGESPRD